MTVDDAKAQSRFVRALEDETTTIKDAADTGDMDTIILGCSNLETITDEYVAYLNRQLDVLGTYDGVEATDVE